MRNTRNPANSMMQNRAFVLFTVSEIMAPMVSRIAAEIMAWPLGKLALSTMVR